MSKFLPQTLLLFVKTTVHPVMHSRAHTSTTVQLLNRCRRTPLDRDPTLGQMQRQTFFTILMHSMALSDLLQAVPHQKFVVPGCKQRGWDVDKDGDPGVGFEGEGLSALSVGHE
jgi:hypothetical protein